MKTSEKGILEICEVEGIVPAPYKDSKAIWTFGIGHTAYAGGLDPREMNGAMPADIDAAVDRAIEIFRDDLKKYEARVNAAITVPLKQHEFDALVSFDFNTGGIHRAKLTKQINAGDMSGDGFMGWLKPPEVRGRRKHEQAVFRHGLYDSNGDTIPIWGTDGKGNLTGIVKTMRGSEMIARLYKADNAPRAGWGRIITSIIAALASMFKRGRK